MCCIRESLCSWFSWRFFWLQGMTRPHSCSTKASSSLRLGWFSPSTTGSSQAPELLSTASESLWSADDGQGKEIWLIWDVICFSDHKLNSITSTVCFAKGRNLRQTSLNLDKLKQKLSKQKYCTTGKKVRHYDLLFLCRTDPLRALFAQNMNIYQKL